MILKERKNEAVHARDSKRLKRFTRGRSREKPFHHDEKDGGRCLADVTTEM